MFKVCFHFVLNITGDIQKNKWDAWQMCVKVCVIQVYHCTTLLCDTLMSLLKLFKCKPESAPA